MRLSLSVFVAVMILVTFSCRSFAAEGTLLVVNRSDGSVSFVDLVERAEVARIAIGDITPHEVAVSQDQDALALVDFLSG